MKLIKIPILVEKDNAYSNLNLPNPISGEEIEVDIYLNMMCLLAVGPDIDNGEIDYEVSNIMLTNGSVMRVPMRHQDLLQYLFSH